MESTSGQHGSKTKHFEVTFVGGPWDGSDMTFGDEFSDGLPEFVGVRMPGNELVQHVYRCCRFLATINLTTQKIVHKYVYVVSRRT